MKARRTASMTARLVTLFAVITIITFAGVGSYLYHALSRQLERRDDSELIGKSQSIEHLMQETPSVAAMLQRRHALFDTIRGHDQLLVRVENAAGEVILQDGDSTSALLPHALSQLPPGQRDLIGKTMPPAPAARYIVSSPALGSGEKIFVMVARTASDRTLLLDEYRVEVWYAACIGMLLASLLSYFLVRSGLRPLRLMASQTHAISANRLDTRLDISTAPEELHEIVDSFNAMLDRLHRSFEQLTQFSADLAHDIRTPLNNLMVQTQVALSQSRPLEQYQALLSSNIEEYERLARMVESMLFLARAENAHVALRVAVHQADTELKKIADYFEGIADEAHVRIEVVASGALYADLILLRRAVSNLVANAIRYTPPGGTIRITATPDDRATIVSVANPGPAIAPHQMARIFDRFYRADPARSHGDTSNGLGLAIVACIMQLHGGSSTVERTAEQQTVFRLRFPHPPTPA